MRVYIAGQKYFGQEVLRLVLAMGHQVAGVSSPAWSDERRPLAEGDGQRPDRLRAAAQHYGLPWLEAGQLRAELLPPRVDLIVAAHSHDFIGRRTRLRASIGAIGYHPSLLPLHRGRDAIRWALHMRERITGGSIYWLNDTVDGGPIAAQDWCFIGPRETPDELWREKLQPMGLRLFARTLRDIDAGRLVKIPQDERLATWEPGWERPPLRRPDLLMLGTMPTGYQIITAHPATTPAQPERAADIGQIG